jgi:DNA-binding PadR family transcriptional regulator
VPDVGTMYRALARLSEQGLIEGAASREGADERRINYRMTALGTRVAKAEARRLHAASRTPPDSPGCSPGSHMTSVS